MKRASHCISCRLDRTIPDLGDADNRLLLERDRGRQAAVGLAAAVARPAGEVQGSAKTPSVASCSISCARRPGGPRVMTGHASGLITLNVEEADDARREKIRHDLHEPYRTLLGHFRHEIGHYYWDRLVWDTAWLERFRGLFGDERADYAAALESQLRATVRRPTGPRGTSAAMRRRIRGRTGPRPGRTTCTSSTASAPRSASASRPTTWRRTQSRSRGPICTHRTIPTPTSSSTCSTAGSS